MENMERLDFNFYKGKTVLVTGHTGFKGTWLCEILLYLGAKVIGYGLEPNTTPSLYNETGIHKRITSTYGDIRDYKNLSQIFNKYKPSVVACACAYIVMKFFKFDNYSESYNKKYYALDDPNSGEHLIKECAKDICLFVDNIAKTNFKSTQNKFSTSKYERASLLVLGK